MVVMRKVGRKKASKNAFSEAAVFPPVLSSSMLLGSVSALKCFSTLDLAIMTREADMERSSLWPPLNQMKNMKTNW